MAHASLQGRPQDVLTKDLAATVKKLVSSERRIAVKEIFEETSISYGLAWTYNILLLYMLKVWTRWSHVTRDEG